MKLAVKSGQVGTIQGNCFSESSRVHDYSTDEKLIKIIVNP